MNEYKEHIVKDGYIYLEEGDEVKEGDEVYIDGPWEIVKHSVGDKAPSPNYTSHRKFRRKVGWYYQQKEIDRLKKENEKLRECVKYIAKPNRYIELNENNSPYYEIDCMAVKARTLLKELEEE